VLSVTGIAAGSLVVKTASGVTSFEVPSARWAVAVILRVAEVASPAGEVQDQLDRPIFISKGSPIKALFGF
jgi:hypothetical protein